MLRKLWWFLLMLPSLAMAQVNGSFKNAKATGNITANSTCLSAVTGSISSSDQINARCFSSIQDAITAAGTAGSVTIPAAYAGTDTYTNPNGVLVIDQRQQTTEIANLTAFMTPWLTKLGASSGGNMTTLAKCIAAGGPCVIDGIGNSILGGGGTVYQNGIWNQIINALRAEYPAVTFTTHNYTLGGRSTQNAVPYTTSAYPQLPLCPTNTPACYSVTPGVPFNSITSSASYGYANPLSGPTNASYGAPFFGADDFPWAGSPEPDFQGWIYSATLDNPDAVFFLFAMNDENLAGYTFAANMQAAIAPFLTLSKVPSVILIAGQNGSVQTAAQSYFSPSKYSNLDEFAEDLRGLAKQYSYGLIDAARIFSSLRDGSDPETPIWQADTAGWNNYSPNWNTWVGSSSATVTNSGYTLSIAATGKVESQRLTLTRDGLVAGVWDTTDVHVIPTISWRSPSGTDGYQALLVNNGGGAWTVTVYSAHGSGGGIAGASGTGLTSSTSFMVQATDNEYRVWVNGKLAIAPKVSTGAGYDYDSIGYGYIGVGTTTSTIGTAYTSSITNLTLEYGSPQVSCATPIANRQAAAPCSPGLATDEVLYGYGTGPFGGNQINHPTVYGAEGVFGVAMVPFFDHLQSAVSVATAKLASGIDSYWTVTSACTTGTGQPVHCVGTTTLPVAMPDANYQLFCTADVASQVGGGIPDYVCSPTMLGTLPTAAGSSITFDVVQVMQNGGGGGTANVYFHAHHN